MAVDSKQGPLTKRSGSQASLLDRFKAQLNLHREDAISSAIRLRNGGAASVLTALVIAIALALPTGLYVLLGNVEDLVNNWGGKTNITLFLKEEVNDEQANKLMTKISDNSRVISVSYIGKDQALKDFKRNSGLDEVIESLGSNPLPSAIVVRPKESDIDSLRLLEGQFFALKEVESVLVDKQWIKRLNAILELGKRFIFALAIALCGAVLLVVFNTIRLSIANRKDEIIITKLVGATDGFVRRPFLYTGFWYGLLGGLISLILVELLIILLQSSVLKLVSLYESSFSLAGVGFTEALTVPFLSIVVAISGSWLAVSIHLRSIDSET